MKAKTVRISMRTHKLELFERARCRVKGCGCLIPPTKRRRRLDRKTIALMADLTHCESISTANFREFGVALTTSNKSFASSPSNVQCVRLLLLLLLLPVGCCSVRFVLDGRRTWSRQILAFDREHRLRLCFGCFVRPLHRFRFHLLFFVFVAPTFFPVSILWRSTLLLLRSLSFDLLPAIIVFPLQNSRSRETLPPVNLRSIRDFSSRLNSCSIVSPFPRRNRSYAFPKRTFSTTFVATESISLNPIRGFVSKALMTSLNGFASFLWFSETNDLTPTSMRSKSFTLLHLAWPSLRRLRRRKIPRLRLRFRRRHHLSSIFLRRAR